MFSEWPYTQHKIYVQLKSFQFTHRRELISVRWKNTVESHSFLPKRTSYAKQALKKRSFPFRCQTNEFAMFPCSYARNESFRPRARRVSAWFCCMLRETFKMCDCPTAGVFTTHETHRSWIIFKECKTEHGKWLTVINVHALYTCQVSLTLVSNVILLLIMRQYLNMQVFVYFLLNMTPIWRWC